MGKFANIDLLTEVCLFNRGARSALKSSTGLSLVQYRIIGLLDVYSERLTPGMASELLNVAPNLISFALKGLYQKGLVAYERNPSNLSSRMLVATKRGLDSCSQADSALVWFCEEFFNPLGSQLKAVISDASLLTATHHNRTRMRNGSHFKEYGMFEGFSITEQFCINTTQSFGLTLGQYRVLECICSLGRRQTMKDIGLITITSKPDVSERSAELASLGLAEIDCVKGDRRRKTVQPTDNGRTLGSLVADSLNNGYSKTLRKSFHGEMDAFNRVFSSLAKDHRAQYERGSLTFLK